MTVENHGTCVLLAIVHAPYDTTNTGIFDTENVKIAWHSCPWNWLRRRRFLASVD